MLTIALGLGSSICWGFADFIGGLQSRRLPVAAVMAVSQGTALVIVTVLLVASGDGPPGVRSMVIAALAGSGSMIALGAFYTALSIGTMSIVAPIASTGAAVPVVVGLATGDRPGPLVLAGIVAAMAGVVLASRESHSDADAAAAGRRAVLLALVAAVGFGSYFVAMDAASGASVVWALFVSRLAGTLAVGAFLAATRTPFGTRGEGMRLLMLAGALDFSAVALYAVGTTKGLLSVLAVLSSLYPVVPVVMGRVWLGERIRRVQQAGVAAALVGVILIAAG
jgi:drug/metabolite transporter (DMT)-like permease